MKRVISVLLVLSFIMLVGCGDGSGSAKLSGTYIEEDGSERTLVFSGKDTVELDGNWGIYAVEANTIIFIFSGNAQTYSFSQVSDSLVIDGVVYTKAGKAGTAVSPTAPPDSTVQIAENDYSDTAEHALIFEEIISEIPNVPAYFKNGMGRISYNSKDGFINEDGKIVIEPKYRSAGAFDNGYALVVDNNKQMFIIDEQGKETSLSSDYAFHGTNSLDDTLNNFANDVVVTNLSSEDGFAVINISGIEVFRVEGFSNCVRIANDHYLFFNCNYLSINEYDGVVYNQSGNKISEISFHHKGDVGDFRRSINPKEDLILVCDTVDGDIKYGYIDKNGHVVINLEYEELQRPSEGLIGFKKYGKWGFIDYTGQVVIEPTYESVYSFSNGLCFVKLENLIGVINKDNDIVIQPEFEALSLFDGYKFNKYGAALIGGGMDKNYYSTAAQFIDADGNDIEFTANVTAASMILDGFDEGLFSFRDPSSDTWRIYKTVEK